MSDGRAQARSTLHLKRLAHGLDSSIKLPGGFTIGLDAILGTIPFLGDAVGALLSTYIVVQAARMGATTPTLLRMMLNVGIESIVGIVPIAGDLFDMAWKANNRNVVLLERKLPHLVSTDTDTASRRLGMATVCLIAGFLLLLTTLLIVTFKVFFHLFGVLSA